MHAPAKLSTQTINHVLLDFENVQEIDPSVVGDKRVSFTILIGAQQKRNLEIGVVQQLFAHAASVQLIRVTSPGKNALDFVLAYQIGRIATTDPGGYIHIVSKDTGFDPLIAHLRANGTKARRHDSFASLRFSIPEKSVSITPTAKPAATPHAEPTAKPAPPPQPKPLDRALDHLIRSGDNRPKKRTALISDLTNLFGRSLPETAIAALIAKLRKAGRLAIDDKGAVTYKLGKA